MSESVTESACAKLTVHLHMTGIREDGYHLIDAEMVSLDLTDRLTFSAGDGIALSGPESADITTGADNLVSKALRLVDKTAFVDIEKQIPHGGGLGGGSADAAAALRWAKMTDPVKASTIGADIPFCLRGGRARVRGIGERLEALSYVERTYTLLLPPFGVNTAAVYSAFDELDAEGRARSNEVNHLEDAAIVVEPRLAEWRDKFRDFTGCEPVLAGSGSTWFVEGNCPPPPAKELAGARWIVTRTTRPISLDGAGGGRGR